MELSVNGRQRRASQASRASRASRVSRVTKAGPQVEKKPAGTSGGTVLERSGSDRASWSQSALAFLQELDRRDMERRQKELEARQQDNSDLEALSKALKVMDKCQKIASRIMRGDKVPPQDEMYLLEQDPDGYKLALACRRPKEKPKEWKSVLDEEDRESGSIKSAGAAESGGGSAEAVETSGEVPEA